MCVCAVRSAFAIRYLSNVRSDRVENFQYKDAWQSIVPMMWDYLKIAGKNGKEKLLIVHACILSWNVAENVECVDVIHFICVMMSVWPFRFGGKNLCFSSVVACCLFLVFFVLLLCVCVCACAILFNHSFAFWRIKVSALTVYWWVSVRMWVWLLFASMMTHTRERFSLNAMAKLAFCVI